MRSERIPKPISQKKLQNLIPVAPPGDTQDAPRRTQEAARKHLMDTQKAPKDTEIQPRSRPDRQSSKTDNPTMSVITLVAFSKRKQRF